MIAAEKSRLTEARSPEESNQNMANCVRALKSSTGSDTYHFLVNISLVKENHML